MLADFNNADKEFLTRKSPPKNPPKKSSKKIPLKKFQEKSKTYLPKS
jgi:hypothetical protein